MKLIKEHTLRTITLLFLLCIGFTATKAQTVNLGKLTIDEGAIFSTLQSFDNQANAELYNDGQLYLYSNFHNDGIVDYLGTTGTTFFVGTHSQLIDGANTAYFYNVYFDNSSNPAPFHIDGDIDIGGQADFTQGIVDNTNYAGKIVFSGTSTTINTADVSHVFGPVFRAGGQPFTYPIGNEDYYRLAGISSPGSSNVIYKGEYFLTDPGAQHSLSLRPEAIKQIDNKEYWTITNSATFNNNTFVTLSWRNVTSPSFIMDAAQQQALTIVRWDDAKHMWVDEGGILNTTDQTITAQVQGLGIFTLAALVKADVQPCHIIVYNAVTPNGDGINDFFRIDNQGNCAKDLHVEIFNRWGVKVFETDHYGPGGDVFDGYSSGRLTIRRNKDQLPTGTYFYILEYNYNANGTTKQHQQAGYLYLSGNSGN